MSNPVITYLKRAASCLGDEITDYGLQNNGLETKKKRKYTNLQQKEARQGVEKISHIFLQEVARGNSSQIKNSNMVFALQSNVIQ